ncbi:MAG: hypothetical protein ACFCUS_03810 [Rubrimonas sp.]|uniref:hypothetical protein n=1 Tax=Rubrimonas sp. TaxID=2036015 RepID=UPI002FDD1A91
MLAGSLAAAPARAAPPEAGTDIAFAMTCRQYDNRARFESREEPVALVAALADACAEARATLARPATPEPAREAARAFLLRLDAARAEIGRINSARTRVAFAAREAALGAPRARIIHMGEMVGVVSPTGEYLILRLGGTLAALEAWVAEGARFPGSDAFR